MEILEFTLKSKLSIIKQTTYHIPFDNISHVYKLKYGNEQNNVNYQYFIRLKTHEEIGINKKTYDDARKAAIEIRKKDPNYRHSLGDRIYIIKMQERV